MEEEATSSTKENGLKVFSILYSKLKNNVKMVKENVNFLKYNIEKQPIVEQLKNMTHLNLLEENADYIKNQTIQKYFEIIDRLFDKDVMDEIARTNKLNTLDEKLNLLNSMRTCLVNLFQTTLYQNLNDLIKVIATYINLIDSTIIKLELDEEVDLSYFRVMVKDVLKFVQKFVFIFDEKDYKCNEINIF